ncbi:hypothetical protein CW304_20875 [Bacillus sp. UFRGS-B20]|nr:hypothetical protein CW304_20875 [Bacillus sp. UFRGS-B20]
MKYVKLSTSSSHLVVIFGTLYAFLFILRQHTIPDSERNNIFCVAQISTRSFNFLFCSIIGKCLISDILLQLLALCCVIVWCSSLSQSRMKGNKKIKALFHGKRGKMIPIERTFEFPIYCSFCPSGKL